MKLTLNEMKELKIAINSLIGQRITYSISVKEGSIREKNNEQYLKDDYALLERILKEIENKKAELE